jgi:hypothetical protein
VIGSFLLLVAASYAGAALNTWLLSGFIPWYFLPDLPFLAIVFSGLFIPGPMGLFVAIPLALFREVTASAPPWSFFLASLALYFASREIGLRLFIRTESYVLATVCALMAAESLSLVLLVLLSGSRPFSLLWGAQETVRITWTSLLAVPLFMDLSERWQRVKE